MFVGDAVAAKVNKKNAKNDDIVGLLHSLLYNKRGKVSHAARPTPAICHRITETACPPVPQAAALKKNILEFSGFVWANEVCLPPQVRSGAQ